MANPILNRNFNVEEQVLEGQPMTISGSVNKTLTLLALVVVSAAYNWWLIGSGFTDKAGILAVGGAIVGFILALAIVFSRGKFAPLLAPVYAICRFGNSGGSVYICGNAFYVNAVQSKSNSLYRKIQGSNIYCYNVCRVGLFNPDCRIIVWQRNTADIYGKPYWNRF